MTDPFSVSCPVCRALPGERCWSNLRELDFAHHARRRAARSARTPRPAIRVDAPPVPPPHPVAAGLRRPAVGPAGSRGARGRQG